MLGSIPFAPADNEKAFCPIVVQIKVTAPHEHTLAQRARPLAAVEMIWCTYSVDSRRTSAGWFSCRVGFDLPVMLRSHITFGGSLRNSVPTPQRSQLTVTSWCRSASRPADAKTVTVLPASPAFGLSY